MYHINKNRAKRWSNKNGNNHNQVGEVVNVMDADLEMEAGLSMLVADKNSLGDKISQTSLPNNKSKTTVSPRTGYILTSVPNISPSSMSNFWKTSARLKQFY